MSDKFLQLQERLEKLLSTVEAQRHENSTLKIENHRLKTELSRFQQDFLRLQRRQNEHSEAVRTKLATALAQVEELESITE